MDLPRLTGRVEVRLRVDATGRVVEARIDRSTGSPALEAAALEAEQKMAALSVLQRQAAKEIRPHEPVELGRIGWR